MKLFDFLKKFNSSLVNFDGPKLKYIANDDMIKSLTEELKEIIDYNLTHPKPVSFFSFNQKVRKEAYRPQNQDFDRYYDFVFSGCSETNGYYISDPVVKNADFNNIWGFQIANKYNQETLNLGMGGWGAESILKGLMHHFQKNGHPKVLLVLFPDLGRMEGVDSDKTKMPSLLNRNDIVQHWFLAPSDDTHYDKVSTIPHDPRNVVPYYHAVYKNLQSIIYLNEYCKQNDIYFKYSSWDFRANVLLKILKEIFDDYNNYCEPEFLDMGLDTFKKLECHKDMMEENQNNIWNIAIDERHMGIHQHTHIAELFMKILEEDNVWN